MMSILLYPKPIESENSTKSHHIFSSKLMNPLIRIRASAYIEQRNARIVIRNHSRISHPRANVDVLEFALGGSENRGDVHVVEGLGVHVVGAIGWLDGLSATDLEEKFVTTKKKKKSEDLLGITVLNRSVQSLIKFLQPRHLSKSSQRLDKGELVEVTGSNNTSRRVGLQNL